MPVDRAVRAREKLSREHGLRNRAQQMKRNGGAEEFQ